MSNIDKVLSDRGNRYGEFFDHARITQNIKAAMRDSPNWSSLEPDMKEALEMGAHKMGRILNGDPFYIDSWTDLVGYPRLIEKRLLEVKQNAEEETFIARDSSFNSDRICGSYPNASVGFSNLRNSAALAQSPQYSGDLYSGVPHPELLCPAFVQLLQRGWNLEVTQIHWQEGLRPQQYDAKPLRKFTLEELGTAFQIHFLGGSFYWQRSVGFKED